MRLLEVIALVDEQLGVNLNANQLAKCETVGQILDILGEKLAY
jgi:acyl carrier protein